MNRGRISHFLRYLPNRLRTRKDLFLNEVIQLDAYYSGILDQMLSAQTAWTAGLVAVPFTEVAKTVGAIYFSNKFARSWWTQVRSDWSYPPGDEFQKIMDEAIIIGELGRARKIYEGIQNDLSQHPGNSSS